MFTTRGLACFAGVILIGMTAGVCQASTSTQPATSQPSNLGEKIGEDYLKLIEDMIATFKGITDVDSAKAAVPAIGSYGARVRDLRSRMQKASMREEQLVQLIQEKHPVQVKALQSQFERISRDKAAMKIVTEALERNDIGRKSTTQENPK